MPRNSRNRSRFATFRAKPRSFWIKFIVGFALIGYIAWLSFIHSLASITWQQNPDIALRFVPDHPLALSRKADELISQSQSEATLVKVEAMAKQSLRARALNPVAVRLLGFVADVRGDSDAARRSMLLSQKISRRDFGTQLWLIEDAVARNDKAKALYHYDIALRTTTSSVPILFPTLIGALDDPEVRSELVPIVKAAPAWLPSFLGEAIYKAKNPADVADILLRSGGLPQREDYQGLSNLLLSQLAEKSRLAAFRQYYLSLKGTSPATLQSAALDRNTVNLAYSQAGWQLVDNAAIGGSFSAFDTANLSQLNAFAGSGERGELMRKYLFLNSGDYQFSARYDAREAATDSEIRWEMRCVSATTNTSKWVTDAPVVKGRSSAAQSFSLGSECPYQLLTLQLAGGGSQNGMEFTLRDVAITRR